MQVLLNTLKRIYSLQHIGFYLSFMIVFLILLFIVIFYKGIKETKKSQKMSNKKEGILFKEQKLKEVQEDITFEKREMTQNLKNFKENMEQEIFREFDQQKLNRDYLGVNKEVVETCETLDF